MIYRIILTRNGKYKKTLYRCKTKAVSYVKYFSLLEKNKTIKFPKKFVNTKKIISVRYEICLVKPTESTDTFRIIKDVFGKTKIEKPIGDWTILAAEEFNIEEKFWIYGNDSMTKRPTIDDVIKKLVAGAHKINMVKQIIIVHNKLLIYNEDQFDMVICKCMEDAQRLHHTLARVAKKQKIKTLLFMGTATPASVSRMYDVIKENTGWPLSKIRRTTTRP